MTTFAAEEAKVTVHPSLLFLLGQLSILSKLGREVRLVVVAKGADGWLSRAIGGPGVVLPVVHLAIGPCGFVGFVGFTRTGGVLTADLRVMFSIVGVNRLDEGMKLVDVVPFANLCNCVIDAARKSIV